jgi:TRAP-type uncharacterized transport system substrate-binding protein
LTTGHFKRIRRYAREWIAAALCLTALAVAVGIFFSQSRPRRYRLLISGGSAEGLRHQIAERLAAEGASHGLSFGLVASSGSREVLDSLDARRLDVAFVQGGLDPSFHKHVRQVAALHVEPLHLLVRPTLHGAVSESLTALKGRTVNLGPAGSGTHDLARDVLKFADLDAQRADGSSDYTVVTLSYRDLLKERDAARLPDAVFTVSAMPSPVVRTLVTTQRYQLVPLPFGEAFALDALNRDSTQKSNRQGDAESDVSKLRIYPALIPPFTYGVDPPTPPREIPTFGPRLLMVAGEHVPTGAVQQILETIFAAPFAQISKPPLEASLLDVSPEYPLHPGTERYRELNKPLLAGDVIDLLEKGTSLAGAVLGALFFLWQWLRQHFRRKSELGFESYMLKVAAIEEQALTLEMGPRLEIRELLRLQRELCRLKNEALARFAEGKLEGGQLMSGFVSHVNDARSYLNRLILHQRDNLEDEAVNERRTAESVWREALGGSSAEHSVAPSAGAHGLAITIPIEPSPRPALGGSGTSGPQEGRQQVVPDCHPEQVVEAQHEREVFAQSPQDDSAGV